MKLSATNALMGGGASLRAGLINSTAPTMLRGPTIAFAPDEPGGPISFQGMLEERAAREPAPAPEPVADEDADPPTEEAPEPAGEGDGGEQAPAGEETAAAAEAPHYWSAEAKAKFAELPAELQAIVAEQESGRERHVQTTQQQAREAAKRAETEAENIKGLVERVTSVVDKGERQFKRVIPELGMTWEEIDWPAWFAKDRETASVFRAQYQAETEELQRLQSARQETETAQLTQHRKAEDARLVELCPDLVDAKDGPRRISELGQFLAKAGVSQDSLKWISAAEMSIAYDAMRFRKAQAAPAQAPAKPPPAKPLRPSSPPAQSNNLKELEDRARRTGSLEDTLALRKARRKG
jgi:hypothetical protein